ncbi:MAG: damage-inducible protein CinA [Chlamydiae bacterium]|nr:MAG: damage-inducible protein CinA [Chlamydiota bacterium]
MKKSQFNIVKKIVALLKQNDRNLCIAESCTGGGIAKAITDVPGCSEVFVGGIIAYSNEIKIRLIGVNYKKLEDFGAVSEEVVIEMADNTSGVFDSDFCIASTGIAGPTGGTIKKPVGTVWLAVATPDNILTLKCHFKGNRERIREQAVNTAIDFLEKEIQNYIDNN